MSQIHRHARARLGRVAASGLSLAILTACQERNYADARLETREASLTHVVDSVVQRESEGARRVADGVQWIEQDIERDAHACAENAGKLDARWCAEQERWEAKQPRIRETTQRIFRGKPERIERTAISMFY